MVRFLAHPVQCLMCVPSGCILATTDGFTDGFAGLRSGSCSRSLISDMTSDDSQRDFQFLAGVGHSNRRTAGTMSTDSTTLLDAAHLTSSVTAGPLLMPRRITTHVALIYNRYN